MKKVFQIFGVIFIIGLVIFILASKIEMGKDSVKQWAQKNQYEIIDIETHMTVFGTPYNWLNKGQNIFEVEINNQKQVLKQGDGFYIPPNTVHGCVCLEKGVLVDVFSPKREDFIK